MPFIIEDQHDRRYLKLVSVAHSTGLWTENQLAARRFHSKAEAQTYLDRVRCTVLEDAASSVLGLQRVLTRRNTGPAYRVMSDHLQDAVNETESWHVIRIGD